ncbi:39S ribosomal protein L22, mitochondrial [Phlebotomus papatasi]|uniref:39S ribosomal protein L22, mitochondrial n=1 Tax=Phlebotomus papatasi TaxID=29031 RepID=UPI0024842BFF|nr:39S ribosomal protein L22, mitochondrial [Phlebotomus papatasi]
MNLVKNLLKIVVNVPQKSQIHSTAALAANSFNYGPRKWEAYNKTIFPPEEGISRPAYVCHVKKNIRYSPKKMWYVACLVRGMSVDEAVKQLSFVLKKGAKDVKNAILEAQKLAVEQHNVEFKSNLWVAESFVGKAKYFKGIRRHARKRIGEVEYKHCHYFVRLEEGPPPANYYPADLTPEQQLDKWMDQMRKRRVTGSL